MDYVKNVLPDGFNPRVLAGGRDLGQLAKVQWRTGFNPRVLAGGRDV